MELAGASVAREFGTSGADPKEALAHLLVTLGCVRELSLQEEAVF